MATKPKTAVVVRKTTAVGSYKDRLAALAKESVAQEASVSTGAFISTKAGQLTWQGNPVQGNKLQVIVADSVMENAYYPGDFDPDNPQPPVCFAFGRDEKDMSPHADSSEPQHETCKGCPQNEFGSADRGKGKACKNIRRIGLLPASPLNEEALRTSEVAFLKTPVTSVKGWAGYVRSLDALHQVPPQAVITEIGAITDLKTQYKLTFNYVKDVPEDLMGIVLDRHEEVKNSIEFPYSPPSSEPVKPAAKKAATKRKY